MNTGDENPYAAPIAAELPTPPEVSLEQRGLWEFLLQGLCAGMLTAPFNAIYFGAIQFPGRKVGVSFYGNEWLSFAGIWIAAVGDGRQALGKIVPGG